MLRGLLQQLLQLGSYCLALCFNLLLVLLLEQAERWSRCAESQSS